MDDFEDKKRFEEAIEAGQRNLRAVHLLSNWCSHSCSGQLKLATTLEFFQYRFSDSFGGNPPL